MPSSRHRWLVIAAAAALAIVAGAFVRQTGDGGVSKPAASQALASAGFRDLQGAPVSLTQWKGKVVVVNFWATWCEPCRKEMPALTRLQQRYAANGLQIVGIALDSAEKVSAFGPEFQVNYPLLLGSTDLFQLMAATGNPSGALPFTVAIDRQGNFRWSHLGALSEDQLEKLVEPMLT